MKLTLVFCLAAILFAIPLCALQAAPAAGPATIVVLFQGQPIGTFTGQEPVATAPAAATAAGHAAAHPTGKTQSMVLHNGNDFGFIQSWSQHVSPRDLVLDYCQAGNSIKKVNLKQATPDDLTGGTDGLTLILTYVFVPPVAGKASRPSPPAPDPICAQLAAGTMEMLPAPAPGAAPAAAPAPSAPAPHNAPPAQQAPMAPSAAAAPAAGFPGQHWLIALPNGGAQVWTLRNHTGTTAVFMDERGAVATVQVGPDGKSLIGAYMGCPFSGVLENGFATLAPDPRLARCRTALGPQFRAKVE